MAKLKEILEIETQRVDDQTTIHLFQEGSFYRAYEMSAWLFTKFVSDFKVTRRMLKDKESSFVFIGFPVTSLEQRLPAGADVEQNGKSILLCL
ncbi:MAG: hypothetical protein MJZ74_04485 [Muribaculaceae bacterium]|nr:hypothetical protein [Muribaculaceae bacterium]